jgi:hypothetical protein
MPKRKAADMVAEEAPAAGGAGRASTSGRAAGDAVQSKRARKEGAKDVAAGREVRAVPVTTCDRAVMPHCTRLGGVITPLPLPLPPVARHDTHL